MSAIDGDWPLVGRSEELSLLRRMRSGGSHTSSVISGAAGVGKSRLAREALAEADHEGWATLAIHASIGLAGVPLAPFRTAFRLPVPAGLPEIMESVADELVQLRSTKGLLLLVDDGQYLDEPSAGLLHQVVAAGLVVSVITVRTGLQPPTALTEIWKNGLAERIELQDLSQRESAELLAAGLGGNVRDSSAARFWHVTAGNPLYLREVVLSSAETGALRELDGEWIWQGEWASGSRLQEIVVARLGRLDPDELTAMELLALTGALPLKFITGLATAGAVQRLEARGLVTAEQSGRRTEIVISQPIHAEVLRSRMPALSQRSMRRNLTDALMSTGARRTSDRVRLACWSLESGFQVDPVTLALGADASLFGIGQTISGRLAEILPDMAVALPWSGPVVPLDYELGIRLARTAYEREGGLTEGVALASALAWTGAMEEAEAVLAGLSGRAEAIDDRVRLELGLASVRFWGHYHVEEAWAGLIEVAGVAEEGGCEPSLLAEIYSLLAGIALNTAQPAAALAHAEKSAAVLDVQIHQGVSAAVAAAALVYLGRCADAMSLVDEALPVVHEAGHPLAVAQLIFTRAAALVRMGDLEEARRLIEWLRDIALADGLLEATSIFGVVLGEILIRQGCPASASRFFRDSVGLFAERDSFGYRPWALSGLARARALTGEEGSSAAALEECRRTQPIRRHFDMSRYLAEIELHRQAGRSSAAVDAAGAGVAWARENGMIIDEALALEAWMSVEKSDEVAQRLAELATLTDSRLVGTIADHARALVASDPESLLAVAEEFAGMSAWWSAAEAAAPAAVFLERKHETRAAQAASRVAATYAARCEGMAIPGDDPSYGSVRLTRREREIAALAATGRSSKDIAEQLFLSSRTVENHLYHVYVKLGVTDRAGLAEAMTPQSPGE